MPPYINFHSVIHFKFFVKPNQLKWYGLFWLKLDLVSMQVFGYDGIMIILNLDRQSSTPIFRQIIKNLQDLFERRVINPGYRMPSTRLLADRLDVSRSTVIKAYEELWALGYLDSRPGSYSIVRKRTRLSAKKEQPENGLFDWEKITSPQSNELHQSNHGFWSLSQKSQPLVRIITECKPFPR